MENRKGKGRGRRRKIIRPRTPHWKNEGAKTNEKRRKKEIATPTRALSILSCCFKGREWKGRKVFILPGVAEAASGAQTVEAGVRRRNARHPSHSYILVGPGLRVTRRSIPRGNFVCH